MRIGVIIAAAGKSSRFGAGDKLSQDLDGRPVLLRTVEAFTKRDEVVAIVVAGPPDDIEGFRSRFGPALGFNGAKIVEGGRTERWESISRAIQALPDDITHIAVHDGARPCIGSDLLGRIFAAAEVAPAVVPGVPVRDTLKRVGDATVSAAADDAIADFILGEDGADTITGDAGNDELYGGLGDDSIEGGEGNDHIEGGDGFDAELWWLLRDYASCDMRSICMFM